MNIFVFVLSSDSEMDSMRWSCAGVGNDMYDYRHSRLMTHLVWRGHEDEEEHDFITAGKEPRVAGYISDDNVGWIFGVVPRTTMYAKTKKQMT